ncbi:MAG TPA: D-hexose-6-phosphate mutarotase [Abditibacterium sp.]
MDPITLPRLQIEKDGASVEIFEQGAHVSRFQSSDGTELLFLSSSSRFEVGKAIRGGVPICFPWFGPKADDPNAPAHGFARTMAWQVADQRPFSVELDLESSEATRALWPHDFEAKYRVTCINARFQLQFTVKNSGTEPLHFEVALHSYFRVSDVKNIEIEGLDGKTYLDKVDGAARKIQNGTVKIEGETDRVYLDAGGPIELRHGERRLKIAGDSGWRSTVVWNPWIEKARSMSDLGDDEWTQFVCIEAGAIADDAITLPAGQSYQLTLEIAL